VDRFLAGDENDPRNHTNPHEQEVNNAMPNEKWKNENELWLICKFTLGTYFSLMLLSPTYTD